MLPRFHRDHFLDCAVPKSMEGQPKREALHLRGFRDAVRSYVARPLIRSV